MTQGRTTYASAPDGVFWAAFEHRLATKPLLADDRDAREDLVRSAYADIPRRPSSSATPEEYADVVYRLRFSLGPTVAAETLGDVRQTQSEEAARLIAEGVDPRLLGLVG